MSRIILTGGDKGGTKLVVPGVIGDYAVPSYKSSTVIRPDTKKIPNSSESGGDNPTDGGGSSTSGNNKPQDDRFVAENTQALQNFDSTKIYEGLITYNKGDKSVYVWKGDTTEEGDYVWEKIGGTSSDADKLTEKQMDDLIKIINGEDEPSSGT